MFRHCQSTVFVVIKGSAEANPVFWVQTDWRFWYKIEREKLCRQGTLRPLRLNTNQYREPPTCRTQVRFSYLKGRAVSRLRNFEYCFSGLLSVEMYRNLDPQPSTLRRCSEVTASPPCSRPWSSLLAAMQQPTNLMIQLSIGVGWLTFPRQVGCREWHLTFKADPVLS